MNTLEARQRLLELGLLALEVVRFVATNGSVRSEDRIQMREILREAREVAYDAGYPGDAAWRALLHANVYVTAPPNEVDVEFWESTVLDLEEGIQQLRTVTESPAL